MRGKSNLYLTRPNLKEAPEGRKYTTPLKKENKEKRGGGGECLPEKHCICPQTNKKGLKSKTHRN